VEANRHPILPLSSEYEEFSVVKTHWFASLNPVWRSKFLMAVNGGARVSTVAARQIEADSLSFATNVFGYVCVSGCGEASHGGTWEANLFARALQEREEVTIKTQTCGEPP